MAGDGDFVYERVEFEGRAVVGEGVGVEMVVSLDE